VIKRILATAVATVVVTLPLASSASAAPTHHGKPGGVVTQAIDWE
jgi:hypothetical protein